MNKEVAGEPDLVKPCNSLKSWLVNFGAIKTSLLWKQMYDRDRPRINL